MKNLIYFIAVIITVTLYSCNGNNPVTPIISTSEGVFVLNEGGMTPGSSKLSYYNSVKDSFYVNIFNPTTLGLFPDGMIQYNSNIYITEQGNYNAPGKIYKTDMNGTVVSQTSIGTNPYSLCAANNKLYITNGPASNVTVADLNSLSTIKNIPVGVYPQEIISYNNNVFVCNTGIFGGSSDSTISVIDASSDAVIKTLTVDKNPSSLAITNSKKLIAASNGTTGKIYVFETVTFTLVDSLYSPYGFSKDFSVDRNTDNVYFIGYDGDIIKLDFNTKTFSTLIGKPSNAFIYGYVFDYINGKHYLADAVNFTSAGNLKIYSANGSYIEEFQTGIAPRRILINKQ